jgi:hypothetical protein
MAVATLANGSGTALIPELMSVCDEELLTVLVPSRLTFT